MIEVEELTFCYRGGSAPSVRDVSLRVPKGEILGILGPSGAGKSTLQKVMTKLLPLQQGSIRYDGVSIDAYGRELFARIGVSFEHPNLFPKLSGRENLTCFLGLYPPRPPERQEDPDALMEAVGLGDAKDKLAGDYSKGMKQRLVLLRSLMHSPDILFLDEPLSGLDPATGERVKALIDDRRRRGVTVILTTHNMVLADKLCDRVAFMHDGAIVDIDSPRALKLRDGDHTLKVEYREGGSLASALLSPSSERDRERLDELFGAGLVETVHSQEATLEQVFIKLTGQALR